MTGPMPLTDSRHVRSSERRSLRAMTRASRRSADRGAGTRPAPLRVTRALRLFAAAGLALGLAGCAGFGGLGGGQTQVKVLDGAVTVAAPPGYCIGPGTVTVTRDTAVVLIGRCIDAGFVTPAVISVSVGHAGSAGVMAAGEAEMKAFFASPRGLAIVSRSGQARDVRLLDTRSEGDAFLMHLDDKLSGNYWRAILGLRGRLVTVKAVGTAGAPLSPGASLRAVERTLRALTEANPAIHVSEQTPASPPEATGMKPPPPRPVTISPVPPSPPRLAPDVSLIPPPRPEGFLPPAARPGG